MVLSSVRLSIILLTIILQSRFCAQESLGTRHRFMGLATKYGLACEEHEVTTEDGYILTVFHIPGDRTRPVLLMHGLIDSSETFIIRGNKSMVVTLAREGYDVWVGNTRGNRYSRNHVTLDPDNDKEYWNFSFHEIGIYDLPAIIEHILTQSGQNKLSCIGHSQGNTIFFALGAIRPEYNDKINVLISMAPVCYLYHLPVPAKYAVESWPLVSDILALIGQEEIFHDNSIEKNLLKTTCSKPENFNFCAKGIFYPLAGEDPEEFEPEFLPTVMNHYPSGTSRKVGTHLFQQGLRREFSQMDYGLRGNLEAYNSTSPPNYDLSKVTMKVALLAAANDGMCALRDVKILKKRLPNVVAFHVLEWSKFNHVDYVWGRNMDKTLYPTVLPLLRQYSNNNNP